MLTHQQIYIITPLTVVISMTFFFIYKWWLNNWITKKKLNKTLELVFLRVRVPKETQKDEGKEETREFQDILGTAEQMFSSFFSLYDDSWTAKKIGQKIISFEIVVLNWEMDFYIVCSTDLEDFVSRQITSFYANANIEIIEDYQLFKEKYHSAIAYLTLKKENFYPIKTFRHLDNDPLNNITNSLGKISPKESAAIQIILEPIDNKWTEEGKEKIREIIKQEKKQGILGKIWWIIALIIRTIFFGHQGEKSDKEKETITPMQEEQIKTIDEKTTKIGYNVVIRVITNAPTKNKADLNLKSILACFNQFNTIDMNWFKPVNITNSVFNKTKKQNVILSYLFRLNDTRAEKMILNTEELASIFHLPNSKYNKTPSLTWQKFKILPPPNDISKEGILIANTFYRGEKREIRISNKDRFRHFYIIGATGTGKSVAMIDMIIQDIKMGNGLIVLDPHGELADDILNFIPKERAEDVIIIDPADTERPIAINLLEPKDDNDKVFLANQANDLMLARFGGEIWGPRLQDYFLNAVLCLMDDEEEGGSLTDVVRLFTDAKFSAKKQAKIKNPIVKDWWVNTYWSMWDREKQEIIPYFAAKFTDFITNATMRNIIGQTKSSFDFAKAMQEKKIILCKLQKGLIGEGNMELLGRIIVTKIQMAALGRATMPEPDRVPFYMYIDEAQNFISPNIESILSEARKYKLGLILAHQYMKQLEGSGGLGEGKVDLKSAILGNVGNMLIYKIGPDDAESLSKMFSPEVSESDFQILGNQNAYMRVSVDNNMSRPFSANIIKYWEDPEFNPNNIKRGDKTKLAQIITKLSRLKYARPKDIVEKEILYRMGTLALTIDKKEDKTTSNIDKKTAPTKTWLKQNKPTTPSLGKPQPNHGIPLGVKKMPANQTIPAQIIPKQN